jgi:aspartyl-tRNA(Asn)/glutamyl-tRNA(Gln) amidotransferase subunit B
MEYEAIIGLEVHVQLKTRTKMFCGTPARYGEEPNTLTSPTCLGLPGALPVPNKEAIILTIQTGLMLDCEIAQVCKFDRKNYFYPDMPKNYQISQYDMPLCKGGGLILDSLAFPKEAQKDNAARVRKRIGLTRIHLEEDVAKSTHGPSASFIDFNRAGTPLMEIVTEPDMRTPEEAYAFLTTLRQILTYGGISDADMEKGQLRCDVNVSVRPVGQEKFGEKCELKNLNSIGAVRRGLRYEIDRHTEALRSGTPLTQETRRWDDDAGISTPMRAKEYAHDYRYFPDPDLLPVFTDQELVEEARKRIPELPSAKKERFQRNYSLTEYQADVLAADIPLADYFERAAAHTPHKSVVANFLINDFLATEPDTTAISIPPEHFAELATAAAAGALNSKQAKEVLTDMLAAGQSPKQIIARKGLTQISDAGALERLCQEAIAANPRSVEDFKAGKAAAINAIKGFVMKATQGKANPQKIDEILRSKL